MDKCLDDEFMAELAKRIEESYKKDVIYRYIADVAENCEALRRRGGLAGVECGQAFDG